MHLCFWGIFSIVFKSCIVLFCFLICPNHLFEASYILLSWLISSQLCWSLIKVKVQQECVPLHADRHWPLWSTSSAYSQLHGREREVAHCYKASSLGKAHNSLRLSIWHLKKKITSLFMSFFFSSSMQYFLGVFSFIPHIQPLILTATTYCTFILCQSLCQGVY